MGFFIGLYQSFGSTHSANFPPHKSIHYVNTAIPTPYKWGQFSAQPVDRTQMVESYCEVMSNRVMLNTRYYGPKKYNDKSKENLLQNVASEIQNQEVKGIYNGHMSKATRKRVTKFLDTWIQSLVFHNSQVRKRDRKHNLVFFTLTLSSKQIHSDNEIKRKIFNPFIDYCKRKDVFENYFWKAEKQKNGNIHFHLIIDKYLDLGKIKKLWNTFQNRLGYLDSYQKQQKKKYKNGYFHDTSQKQYNRKTKSKEVVPHSIQLKRYQKGTKSNWSSPNSIDLRKLDHQKNIINYLLKYLVKGIKQYKDESQEQFEKRKEVEHVQGRIWGCSDEIKKILPFTINTSNSSVDSLLNYCKTSNNIRAYYPDDMPVALFYFKERKDLNQLLEGHDLLIDYQLYQSAILYSLYGLKRYENQYTINYLESICNN